MQPTSDSPSSRRLSVKRRGADPGTVTSTAAQDAIQQVIDRRARRRSDAPRVRTADRSLPRPVPSGVSAARRVIPVIVFVGVVVVLWQAAAGFATPRLAGPDSTLCGFSGAVMFGGRPLAQAVLELHPIGGAAGTAPMLVETDHTGSFTRPASHGVAAGRYAVVVRSGCVMPRPGAEFGQTVVIPTRYLRPESTPLQVAVNPAARLVLELTR